MEDLVFAIAVFVCGLSLLYVFFIDLKQRDTIYFPASVILIFALQFVVLPVCLFFFQIGFHPDFPQAKADVDLFIIAEWVAAIFFIAFAWGFKYGNKKKLRYILFIKENTSEGRIVIWLFFISIVAFSIFVFLYGGINYVLENASKIRSGYDENKNYLGAFFKLFSYYIEFVLFFSYAKLLEKKDTKWRIIFLFLIILCFGKSMADAGRGGLLNIILGIFFISNLHSSKLSIKKIATLAVLVYLVTIFGKSFLFQLYVGVEFGDVVARSSSMEKMESFLVEFSHPFLSLILGLSDAGVTGARFFSDFFVWLIKPLKLIGIPVADSVSYYNTYLFAGEWASDIPPGIVAFAYHEGGVFFVPIFGFFMGFLLNRIDFFVKELTRATVRRKAFALATAGIILIYLPFIYGNTDPALFIQWFLAYILLFAFLLLMGIFKLRKLKQCSARREPRSTPIFRETRGETGSS
jgi:oligosaccharide repeat unit polymerase